MSIHYEQGLIRESCIVFTVVRFTRCVNERAVCNSREQGLQVSSMKAEKAGGLGTVATAGAAVVLAFCVGFGAVAHVCGGAIAPGSLRARLCLAANVAPAGFAAPALASAATSTAMTAGVAHDPWIATTHPKMGTEGWNWTQLAFTRASNFPAGGVKRYSAQEVKEKGQMWLWHTAYARSVPTIIEGLGKEYSDRISKWKIADYRREWGPNKVTVAFSDISNFNSGRSDPNYGRVINHPDRVMYTMNEFLDLVANPHPDEHIAVQQSPSQDFSEFGLPPLPPLLEELTKHTLNARNFWAAVPPKVSVLHYDWQDSVLMQISGTKRFTIIDPARMQTAYPCVAYLQQLKRVGPGKFERIVTGRELDNFPLLNVTHPDYARHPLAKDASVFQVTINEGDALLLPAYWYHQVDSYAEPGKLNVAVNFWFQGHSLATRLYRTLRENLFINCTEKTPPGIPHPCRDSSTDKPTLA